MTTGEIESAIVAGLTELRQSESRHLDMGRRIQEADGGVIWPVDVIALAALHRSLMLINGFVVLVEQMNPLCAVPMVRFQLDNLMRLNACRLVDDAVVVMYAMRDNTPLAKIKGIDGKPLTDKYLYEELTRCLPWVTSVYRSTSAFVHFSAPVLYAPFTGDDSNRLGIGDAARGWEPEERRETVAAFTAATDALLQLVDDWLKRKPGVPSRALAAGP
jgi:hypothetical protein